jgi:MarR family transcriptional regulator, transcriptional regulator for hemolysin
MWEGLEASLLARVAKLDRLARAWLEPRLADHGISLAEFRLVGMLLNTPEGVRQRDLAERLRITEATLSVEVRRLERAGVIQRVADPNDARSRLVKLPQDAPLTADVLAELEQLERLTTAKIKTSDLDVARRVLCQLQHNLQHALEDEQTE